MNFLRFTSKACRLSCHCFHTLVFLLLKKPLYMTSYNSNGNRFRCKGIMTQCSLQMSGKNNQLIIEQGVRLNKCRIVIGGVNNRVIIHRNVKFYEGGRIKLEDENNLIELGENSDFVNCFFAVSDYDSKVVVGRDCMFSANIVVRNSDVHSILNDDGKRINHAKDTCFGDRVWVGYGVHILKGSRIEDDAVIGTQSVVAGLYVPAGCVAAGNPARVVKQNIHWCRERLRP